MIAVFPYLIALPFIVAITTILLTVSASRQCAMCQGRGLYRNGFGERRPCRFCGGTGQA